MNPTTRGGSNDQRTPNRKGRGVRKRVGSWSGSNRLFGWMAWREMNPQWWSLGLLLAAVRNNVHVQVTFAKRSYSVQLWRGDA